MEGGVNLGTAIRVRPMPATVYVTFDVMISTLSVAGFDLESLTPQ